MNFSDILKSTGKTDKNTAHTYGQWYDLWFEPYRDKAFNLLEVGVCVFGGGSCLAFAEYFQKAKIWAVDIDGSKCHKEFFDHPRIKFIEADAYKPQWLHQIEGQVFDIVVDDASHEIKDQLKLLKMLHPWMAPTGFYVVEDCCTDQWRPRLHEAWALGLRHTLIDMSTKKTYDNTLIRFDGVPLQL